MLKVYAAKLHKKLREKVSYQELTKIKQELAKKKMSLPKKAATKEDFFAHHFLNKLDLQHASFIQLGEPLEQSFVAELKPFFQAPYPANRKLLHQASADLAKAPTAYVWSRKEWQAYNFLNLAKTADKQPAIEKNLAQLGQEPNIFLDLHGYLWKTERRGRNLSYVLNPASLFLPPDQFKAMLQSIQQRKQRPLFFLSAEFKEASRALFRPPPSIEEARGVWIDLEPIFLKVLETWFPNCDKNSVKIGWGKNFSTTILGSYNFLTSTIQISLIFDSEAYPLRVLEYIIFHELLHHVLGVTAHNERLRSHTPDFRRIEASYPNQAKLERELQLYLAVDWRSFAPIKRFLLGYQRQTPKP